METLLERAAQEGIRTAFVPADDEDQEALDFYRGVGGVGAPVTVFSFESDETGRS